MSTARADAPPARRLESPRPMPLAATAPLRVLLACAPADTPLWAAEITAAAAAGGVAMTLSTDPAHDPAGVEVIVYAPSGPLRDFSPYIGLRAVLSLWAGVESIVGNPSLTVPLARMAEPGLTEGMTDWVCAHALRLHVGLDRHIGLGPGDWPQDHPPLSRDRRVGVLGLGELGADAAAMLARLRFDVAGWARRPREVAGVDCRHGPDGLVDVLARSEILVLLLPATPDTDNLMNAERLALLPRGAAILNPGRGALIDDAALVDALDTGQVSHAVLDVFRTEPLPPAHPFWAHPRVTITPHIAAVTRPHTAARAVAAQMRRLIAGEPLRNVVDRARGY